MKQKIECEWCGGQYEPHTTAASHGNTPEGYIDPNSGGNYVCATCVDYDIERGHND